MVDRAGGPGRPLPADGRLRRPLFPGASSVTTPVDRSGARSPVAPLTAEAICLLREDGPTESWCSPATTTRRTKPWPARPALIEAVVGVWPEGKAEVEKQLQPQRRDTSSQDRGDRLTRSGCLAWLGYDKGAKSMSELGYGASVPARGRGVRCSLFVGRPGSTSEVALRASVRHAGVSSLGR